MIGHVLESGYYYKKGYFMSKILMGRNNPHGITLEELLKKVGEEVAEKSELIKNSPHPQRDMIIEHNSMIIDLLKTAEKIQRDTYKQLDAVAPNEGPSKPRL